MNYHNDQLMDQMEEWIDKLRTLLQESREFIHGYDLDPVLLRRVDETLSQLNDFMPEEH